MQPQQHNQQQNPRKDVENIEYTVTELLKYRELAQYVEQHCENQFEKLENMVIQDLVSHKRNALARIPQNGATVEVYDRMAAIFINYRKGVVHMEMFYDKAFKRFLKKLKTTLKQTKKVREGVTYDKHVQWILGDMKAFVKSFRDEYHRILPMIFPEAQIQIIFV